MLRDCHGGLVGINYKKIEDSYAVGSFYGGGVCGTNKGEILRCYGDYAGKTLCAKEKGNSVLSTVKKGDKTIFEQWDKASIWTRNSKGFPIFEEDKWFEEI